MADGSETAKCVSNQDSMSSCSENISFLYKRNGMETGTFFVHYLMYHFAWNIFFKGMKLGVYF